MENLLRYNIRILLFVALTFALASCLSSKDKRKLIISDLLGKQFKFPDTLKQLSPQSAEISTVKFALDSAAVFTYIFGDCSSCIEKIKQWNEFFHQEAFTDLQPVMVVYTHDLTAFLWNYRPLKSTNQYQVYLDLEQQITQLNDLPKSKAYHTLLLDSTGKVLAVGNPLRNPKLEKLYREQIQKRSH